MRTKNGNRLSPKRRAAKRRKPKAIHQVIVDGKCDKIVIEDAP